MLIGTLAISGIFPFAGFWSKDAILESAFSAGWGGEFGGKILYAIGLFTALLTAFYMWRMMAKTFDTNARFVNGELPAQHHSAISRTNTAPKITTPAAKKKPAAAIANQAAGYGGGKVHESPPSMMIPLYVLAFLSAVAGNRGVQRLL